MRGNCNPTDRFLLWLAQKTVSGNQKMSKGKLLGGTFGYGTTLWCMDEPHGFGSNLDYASADCGR